MSVIAVKVTPESIVIGSDSIRVRRYAQEKLEFAKLRELNDMVIGSSGQAHESSLLFIFAKTRRPTHATETDIVEFFSEFQEWARKKTAMPNDIVQPSQQFLKNVFRQQIQK